MDARQAYIALNLMADIGPVSVRTLAAALGGPAALLTASARDLRAVPGVAAAAVAALLAQRATVRPDAEETRARRLGFRLLTPAEAGYPKPLAAIHDPPLALYVWGALAPGDARAMAVVGSRHPTIYGRDTAERLAYHLARAGFTVVSGLARGIDTAAHRGALKGGGRTLAVLGGALDCLYPEENAGLARDLSAQGAVLSEFPLGRKPDKTTFPMRNRIVSGLSMGVLVVEAGPTSGALITAAEALDQGRAVFAVPGRVDSPAARGCHRLIKAGARLVEDLEDILQEFEFLIPPDRRAAAEAAAGPPLSPEETRIVAALAEGEQDLDSLTRATGLAAAPLSALILGLEMKRVVRMLPGRRVMRIRR